MQALSPAPRAPLLTIETSESPGETSLPSTVLESSTHRTTGHSQILNDRNDTRGKAGGMAASVSLVTAAPTTAASTTTSTDTVPHPSLKRPPSANLSSSPPIFTHKKRRTHTSKVASGAGGAWSSGQRAFLPGLDDDDEEDADNGAVEDTSRQENGKSLVGDDASDDGVDVLALAYLRSVRREARRIPHVMSGRHALAQGKDEGAGAGAEEEGWKKGEEQDGDDDDGADDDEGGYYSDGAYISTLTRPTPPPAPSSPSSALAPRDAYTARLRQMFLAHRARLASTSGGEFTAGGASPLSPALWRKRVRGRGPAAADAREAGARGAVRVAGVAVRVAGYAASSRGGGRKGAENRCLGRRAGAWAWAMAGAWRPVEEMGCEEVGAVREVGRRAGMELVKAVYGVGGAEADLAGEREEEESVGEGVDEAEEGGAEDAEAKAEATRAQEECASSPPADGGNAGDASEEGQVDQQEDYERSATSLSPPTAASEPAHHRERLQRAASSEEALEDAQARAVEGRGLRDEEEMKKEGVEGKEGGEEGDEDLDSGEDRLAALAALDMVLWVVGEMYGQRDLLAGRVAWGL